MASVPRTRFWASYAHTSATCTGYGYSGKTARDKDQGGGCGKEILRLLLHPSRPTRDLAVTLTHPSLHLPKSFVFSFHDTRHMYEMRITRRSHTGIHCSSPALRQPTYAEAYAVASKPAALQIVCPIDFSEVRSERRGVSKKTRPARLLGCNRSRGEKSLWFWA